MDMYLSIADEYLNQKKQETKDKAAIIAARAMKLNWVERNFTGENERLKLEIIRLWTNFQIWQSNYIAEKNAEFNKR